MASRYTQNVIGRCVASRTTPSLPDGLTAQNETAVAAAREMGAALLG